MLAKKLLGPLRAAQGVARLVIEGRGHKGFPGRDWEPGSVQAAGQRGYWRARLKQGQRWGVGTGHGQARARRTPGQW